LLALLAHHIFHVSRIRVKQHSCILLVTFIIMWISYIKLYIHPKNEPPFSDNHALIARNKSNGKHRNKTATPLNQDVFLFKFKTGNSLLEATQMLLPRQPDLSAISRIVRKLHGAIFSKTSYFVARYQISAGYRPIDET